MKDKLDCKVSIVFCRVSDVIFHITSDTPPCDYFDQNVFARDDFQKPFIKLFVLFIITLKQTSLFFVSNNFTLMF